MPHIVRFVFAILAIASLTAACSVSSEDSSVSADRITDDAADTADTGSDDADAASNGSDSAADSVDTDSDGSDSADTAAADDAPADATSSDGSASDDDGATTGDADSTSGTAGTAAPDIPANDDLFRVAIVLPGPADDRGSSESMVTSLQALRSQGVFDELEVVENIELFEDGIDEVRRLAEDDHDLVIAHGTQYGGAIIEVAPIFPATAFAWGMATDTFGLPNVSAYDVAAQEGGYVLGTVAALMFDNHTVAAFGPIEVGDDKQFVDGFFTGAAATGAEVDIRWDYVDSFVHADLAEESANNFVATGGPIVFGATSPISAGVIQAAIDNDVPYFGNQVQWFDQEPDQVVASQVYRWEVILDDILLLVAERVYGGESFELTLANNGLVIEFNPDYDLSQELRDEAQIAINGIAEGSIDLP